MSFIITKDHNPDSSYPEGTNCNAKGVKGPRNSPVTDWTPKNYKTWIKFQMGDDDGNVYYTGYWIEDDCTDWQDFEPLDCFGTPNAGCVWIRHWDPINKKWGPYI